jgi:hypothetical protein
LPPKKKNPIDEMVFKIATSKFEKSPLSICQPHTRKPNVKERAHARATIHKVEL